MNLKASQLFGVCFPPAMFSFSGSGRDRVEGKVYSCLGFCQACSTEGREGKENTQ